MPTIEKRPEQPWPNAARDLEIVLLPGTHQPHEFSGARDMILRAAGPGVIIRGSINPGGGEPPCTLRFNDGCDGLRILGPLEICYSEGRGIRITVAEDIILSDLFCHHNGIEGVITGDCPHGTYENITVEDSRDSPDSAVRREYPPDKRHGIYISGNADGSTVRGLYVERVTGSAIQVNGAGMNAVVVGLTASEMVFVDCGSSGTPPISLMACRQCDFERFNIARLGNTNGRWGVLFDDGKGEEYACYDNTFQAYTVPPGSHPAEEGGSSGNTFNAGAGWEPEPEPGPEPEPEWVDCAGCVAHDPPYPAGKQPATLVEPGPTPPVDNTAVLAALDAIQVQLDVLQRTLQAAQTLVGVSVAAEEKAQDALDQAKAAAGGGR